jgi:hypothetical protein
MIVTPRGPVLESSPYTLRNLSRQGFPQLWKNLWKIRVFAGSPPVPALKYRHSMEAKVQEGAIFLVFLPASRVTPASHRCDSGRKCQFS